MDNRLKNSVIHNLEQLRAPFEAPTPRTQVAQFGPETFYLKPTLIIHNKEEGKVESIRNVVHKWPEDDLEVKLRWVYEGFELNGQIMGIPVTDGSDRWQCSMKVLVKRDGVAVVKVDPDMDVVFDDTPRPPKNLIEYLVNKIRKGETL